MFWYHFCEVAAETSSNTAVVELLCLRLLAESTQETECGSLETKVEELPLPPF
jgi:hypothetical protein